MVTDTALAVLSETFYVFFIHFNSYSYYYVLLYVLKLYGFTIYVDRSLVGPYLTLLLHVYFTFLEFTR